MSNYKSDKETKRIEVISSLKALSPKQRNLAEVQAGNQLASTQCWKSAHCILVYISVPIELGTEYVIRNAWHSGKNVFSPRVNGENLEFWKIDSWENSFITGSFGLREPKSRIKLWKMTDYPGTTLIIVPGLAFDIKGRRLGRGGGFYDRFLSQMRVEAEKAGFEQPVCLGFAFKEQIFTAIPFESHDMKMDGLVSPDLVRKT